MPLQPLGDRAEAYVKHLQGCRNHYKDSGHSESCDLFEYHRMLMNQRQPQSMKNYTDVGFLKTKAPASVIELINTFWNQNQHKGRPEAWQDGNIYVNHWDTPTSLVSVDDTALRGSGGQLKTQIWSAASALMEAWTETELQVRNNRFTVLFLSSNIVRLTHLKLLCFYFSRSRFRCTGFEFTEKAL